MLVFTSKNFAKCREAKNISNVKASLKLSDFDLYLVYVYVCLYVRVRDYIVSNVFVFLNLMCLEKRSVLFTDAWHSHISVGLFLSA